MPGLSAAYWVYNSLRLKSNLKLPMTTKQGKNSLCLNLAGKTWHQLLTPNPPPPQHTHSCKNPVYFKLWYMYWTCHQIWRPSRKVKLLVCFKARGFFLLRFWPPYTRVHVLVWVNMEIIAPVDALNIFIMINHSSEN